MCSPLPGRVIQFVGQDMSTGGDTIPYLEELSCRHVVVPYDLLLQAIVVIICLFAAAHLGSVIPICVYICHLRDKRVNNVSSELKQRGFCMMTSISD